MTRDQLVGAVAGATGESPRTIDRLGFSLGPRGTHDLPPEDLTLVVDCPFCRRPVPYPGRVRGALAMGECERCDVYFDFEPDEVYALGADDLVEPRHSLAS